MKVMADHYAHCANSVNTKCRHRKLYQCCPSPSFAQSSLTWCRSFLDIKLKLCISWKFVMFVDRFAVKVDKLDVVNLHVSIYLMEKSDFMNFENNIKLPLLLFYLRHNPALSWLNERHSSTDNFNYVKL